MTLAHLDHWGLHLHKDDDVAVAIRPLRPGQALKCGSLRLTVGQDIPTGHKIALRHIAANAPARKYGQVIGVAKKPISPGEHVHTHNLGMSELPRPYEFCVEARPLEPYPPDQLRYFQGYARTDGRVGTRNYVAVISTVNCSASVARQVAEQFRHPDVSRDFPNVAGVLAFTHKGGCGVDPGEPLELLQRVLAGIVRHPNIAGSLLIGLGCEVNQVQTLLDHLGPDQLGSHRLKPTTLNIQHVGGVRRTVEAGVREVACKLLPLANTARRTSQPVSKLILAENCGGSDAYSGITANPALGVASDQLVRYGGTSVLAETPEIYGAEHLLLRRAATPDQANKLLALIRWWEDHVRQHGCTIDNNPSVGNKAGGITTILEKSLGAIAKAGQAPLVAVYRYAEPITTAGLCFMDTPGYDPVSMTGLVAGGCNIGVFTTGRGSVYGCRTAPCIKVASHTPLFLSMNDDIDLNAGTILDGTETVEQVGYRILEKIIAVASGDYTKSELADIGHEEFAPWMLGPTF